MGLYHLQIRQGKSEAVIELAKASGISFARVTNDEYGTHYWFKRTKQNREVAITITKIKEGKEHIRMGVSPLCNSLAKNLEDADLIVPFEFKNKKSEP